MCEAVRTPKRISLFSIQTKASWLRLKLTHSCIGT